MNEPVAGEHARESVGQRLGCRGGVYAGGAETRPVVNLDAAYVLRGVACACASTKFESKTTILRKAKEEQKTFDTMLV